MPKLYVEVASALVFGALRPVGPSLRAIETKPEQSRRQLYTPSGPVAVPDWLYWMLRSIQFCARATTSARLIGSFGAALAGDAGATVTAAAAIIVEARAERSTVRRVIGRRAGRGAVSVRAVSGVMDGLLRAAGRERLATRTVVVVGGGDDDPRAP